MECEGSDLSVIPTRNRDRSHPNFPIRFDGPSTHDSRRNFCLTGKKGVLIVCLVAS
jgi:hypothetical protein